MNPETLIQRDVVQLYRRIGAAVYIVGANAPRNTRRVPNSAGLPDLEIWHRGRRLFWKHEVKTPSGDLSAAQREYVELAEWCGVPTVVGGLAEALHFLREKGLAT